LAERTSPASPESLSLALAGAAEDHLDEDRDIAAQVLSWLDVEIGQRDE
jgi:hypothetical protein